MSARVGRVCLVVDHPLRDLDGLVLVAAELASRGVDVHLVPMYHKHEVFLLAPDAVLLNYVRFANIDFVRACRRLGITVAVLDTEGGVRQDMTEYAEQLRPYLDDVSALFVWGRAQLRAIEPVAAGRTRVVLTGSPRYDFAAEPWRSALGDVDPRFDEVILVNANFPLADPRFQDPRRESRELVEGMHFDAERVNRLKQEVARARAAVTDAVASVARALPDARIVLRPHPFERHDYYREAFAGLPNAQVVQSGSVLHWIAKARVVLHHNCSTAVETFLMGREPVFLSFVEAPLLEQPTSIAVSTPARSLDDLVELCRAAVNGGPPPASEGVRRAREEVVREFFAADDGASHRRVADALLAVAAQDGGATRASLPRVFAAQRRAQVPLNLLASWIGGAGALERLRRITHRPADPAKAIDAGLVRERLRALTRVAPAFCGLAAAQARAPHTRARLASVRIARGAGET